MAVDVEAFRKEVYNVVASIPREGVKLWADSMACGMPKSLPIGGKDASWSSRVRRTALS